MNSQIVAIVCLSAVSFCICAVAFLLRVEIYQRDGFSHSTIPNTSSIVLSRRRRMMGGRDTEPGRFPYLASLHEARQGFFCGGSILSEHWILTAAHCIGNWEDHFKNGSVVVKAGKHNLRVRENSEQTRRIGSFYTHELHNRSLYGINDVGLIKLLQPLELNDRVSTIKLPRKNSEFRGNASISGWGAKAIVNGAYAYPARLKTLIVSVVEARTCDEVDLRLRHKDPSYVAGPLRETNICVGPLPENVSACYGDSGSPLTVTNQNNDAEVIGVLSFVSTPCGHEGGFNGFMRVSSFIDWINNAMLIHET